VEEVGKEEKMCGMDPPIMETHLLVTSMLPVMAVSSHLSMTWKLRFEQIPVALIPSVSAYERDHKN